MAVTLMLFDTENIKQIIISSVLSRKIINIYNDIARKYGNVTVKDFRRYEKLEYKKNKLKLGIDFL